MARIGALPLLAQPGEAWFYHTGLDLAGVLIARAARQPLSQFMQDRLFAPLGMEDTGFFVPEGKRDRLVTITDAIQILISRCYSMIRGPNF